MGSHGGIIGTIAGAIEIAVGVVLSAFPATAPLGAPLIMAGIATEIGGIIALTAKDPVNGTATTTRNSISPWRHIYGECRVGGALLFQSTFGTNNQVLDLVSVLAAHPCQEVDELLFDQQRVQIDLSKTAETFAPLTHQHTGYNGAINYHSGTSFQPLNYGQTPYDITTISRSINGIITVAGLRTESGTPVGIPFLTAGDKILIRNVNLSGTNSSAASSLNGKFQVAQILSYIGSAPASFTCLSGGPVISVSGANNAGEVVTQWADYDTFVYFEWLDGTQQLGQTFSGMVTGTPWCKASGAGGGFVQLITPSSPTISGGQSAPNPWVPDTFAAQQNCSLVGKTATFLRLLFRANASGAEVFTGGIPQVSYHCFGLNTVLDPRTTATCTSNGTGINSVTVTGTSHNYQFPPTINVIPDPRDTITTPAKLTAVMSPVFPPQGQSASPPIANASLASITITTAGAGYVHQPTIQIAGYTNNSALCIADYLCNQVYGFKLNYVTDSTSPGVPVAELITAANLCDDQVLLQDGTYESRYTCNGSFELTTKRGEILEQLLSSAGARLTTVAGRYIIHPAYSPATYPTTFPTYDLQALSVGPIVWKSAVSVRDLVNGVKGTYISKDNSFKSTDYPPMMLNSDRGYFGPAQYGGDIFLAADGGDRRWEDLPLPMTSSYSMAQRLAKISLMRRRQMGTGTFTLTMAAFNIIPLDIIQANCAILQWSNKQLEVSGVRLISDKQSGEDGNDVVMLSYSIDVQETDSSVYQWNPGSLTIQGEELTPQGLVSAPLPTNVSEIVEVFPFPWSPGFISGLPGDALPYAPANFGMQPIYGWDAEGNSNVSLAISGYSPLNDLDDEVALPFLSATGLSTGGSIADGSYVLAMSARDAGGSTFDSTPFLNFQPVTLTGAGTNSILTTFGEASGDDGGDLYMAVDTGKYGAYTWHRQKTVLPTDVSVTLTTFDQTTPGGSDPLWSQFGVSYMHEIHGGVWDAQVQAVTADTVTLAASGMTADQYAGYTLSLVAKYDATATGVLNMPVLSNTASDGNNFLTFTIGPNALGVQLPDLTTLLDVSDWIMVRTFATFTQTSFGDNNIANGEYPTGDTGIEQGHIAIILSGQNAGDFQTIDSVSNDVNGNPTIYNLVGTGWTILPAQGDFVVVADPSTLSEFRTTPIKMNQSQSGVVANPPVDNLTNAAWVFWVRTEDINGNHCSDNMAPIRDCIILANGGTRTIST